MIASVLIAAVVTTGVVGLGAPVDNPIVDDAVYPSAVRQGLSQTHQAIPDDLLRMMGHGVCIGLDSGKSKVGVAQDMMSGFNEQDPADPLTPGEAGYVIGASIAAYCPDEVSAPDV